MLMYIPNKAKTAQKIPQMYIMGSPLKGGSHPASDPGGQAVPARG